MHSEPTLTDLDHAVTRLAAELRRENDRLHQDLDALYQRLTDEIRRADLEARTEDALLHHHIKRLHKRLDELDGKATPYTEVRAVKQLTAASTLGSGVRKTEVFDKDGASLGFIPIYDSISARPRND